MTTRMNEKADSLLTIGELARLSDVHIETIRFYQRRGLLAKPIRPATGIRHYGDAEIARIKFIRSAQNLGFSLDEITTLLTLEDGAQCNEASRIAQQKLSEVRSKLAHLRRMEKTLSELLGECNKTKGQVYCPLISSLQAK